MAALARALACPVEAVAGRLYDLAKEHGAPTSLAELGFKHEEVDRAMALATRNPYCNPRSVTVAGIREVLENALVGNPPDLIGRELLATMEST